MSDPVRAVIDTGATYSVVPQTIVDDFESRGCPVRRRLRVRVKYANQLHERLPSASLEVELIDSRGNSWRTAFDAGHHPRGLVVLPRPDAIIGMDIIRFLRLTIDGPACSGFVEGD